MSLIAVTAGKGAPGVTTSAVSLGAVWPRRALVAECDPSGGDLVFRFRDTKGRPLAQDRGLLSLATRVRSGLAPDDVWQHTQTVAGGLDVLVGPSSPVQTTAMAVTWRPLAGLLAGLGDADVIADCGRLDAAAPTLEVVTAADLVVVLARATAEGAAHLRSAVQVITDLPGRNDHAWVGVVVLADPRDDRAVGEVEQVLLGWSLTTPVLGRLAVDPVGAAGLRGEWGRRLDRAPLVESARVLARYLDQVLADRHQAA